MKKDETSKLVKESIMFAIDRVSKDIQEDGTVEGQRLRAEIILTLMKAYYLAK